MSKVIRPPQLPTSQYIAKEHTYIRTSYSIILMTFIVIRFGESCPCACFSTSQMFCGDYSSRFRSRYGTVRIFGFYLGVSRVCAVITDLGTVAKKTFFFFAESTVVVWLFCLP